MVLLFSQILFTFSKLWAKYYVSCGDDFVGCLHMNWLPIYVCIHAIATLMQLYVFKTTTILKAMTFFSGISLILTIVLSYIFFDEILDLRDVISLILVLIALILVNGEKQKSFAKK